MRLVYGAFINHEGDIQHVEADLDGNVTVKVNVNGKFAKLMMPAKEAALLFRELKKLDVEALARIYAA